MAKFKPYKITESQLSSLPIVEGQLIFVTDKEAIYLDVSSTKRIKITSKLISDLTNDKGFIIKEVNTNLINGEAEGSLRTINASENEELYHIGENSFAQGESSKAPGKAAHAEGFNTWADGDYSHAEGWASHSYGDYSHAEGFSESNGLGSHAEGNGTIASGRYSHVQGTFNIEDTSDEYAHIIGNGNERDSRSNAHTLDWEGNAWYAGDVYVGSTSGTNKDSGSVKLVKTTDLKTVATSGSYNDLTNKPTIPTKISQLTNDSGYTKNTGTITGVSVNGTSVATSGVANITSIPASILSGAIKNGVTATTQADGDNSTKVATTAYVDKAIQNLPEPMIFKGSLGTSGTITSLPVAATSNKGYTYKVITAGTYANQSAKVGDTFISDGKGWVLIPSGDEPNGTVTSVTLKATGPISIDNSTAITTSGTRTLSHATSGATAGNYGDSANQTPSYGGTFKVPYLSVNATGHVTGISEHTVKIPASDNTNTTYTLTQDSTDGHKITLTPSSGSPTTITIPDNNTQYSAATTTTPGLMSASDKTKLNGIANSAQVNKIEKIQKNGKDLDITTSKTVNISVPTKVSELTNDSGYVTSSAISDTLPIGSVIEWYSDTIPDNWLLCNGQAVSRTDYSALFEVIGTTYGTGNGTTTFNLPNKMGRVGVGKSDISPYDQLGSTGGETTHTLTLNEMPKHSHSSAVINPSSGSGAYPAPSLGFSYTATKNGVVIPLAQTLAASTSGYLSSTMGNYQGGNSAHNNMPPYIITNYIIKASQTAPVTSKTVDNLTSTSSSDALSANQGRILDTKVSASVAPPDISDVAKLWVDTTYTVTGDGHPDLLYNNSSDGEWVSLLDAIKPKYFQAYFASASYTESSILGFGDTTIDTTKGKVTANANGLLTINYNGLVRIKAQIWENTDQRPWLRLQDYDNHQNTITEVIDDSSSGYVSQIIETIIQNTGSHRYDFYVGINAGGFTVNGNSGNTVGSHVIVELL